MNTIMRINEASFDYYKKVFPLPFSELKYDNQKSLLSYYNQTTNIKDINLQDILDYNSFNIRSYTSERMFELIKVHVDTLTKIKMPTDARHKTILLRPVVLSGEAKDNLSENDLISMDTFIILLNKEEDFNNNDQNLLRQFFKTITMLIRYEGALTLDAQNVLDYFYFLVEKVKVKPDSNNHKFILKLLDEAQINSIIFEEIKEREYQPILKAGYVSASVIIFSVLNVGVAIALFLFMRQ